VPEGSAPPPLTFFLGPPGAGTSRKNAIKRARCARRAHRWPQSGHWGAPGTPRCSTRRQKVFKSAHLEHPGWHKPSKNGVLPWENTHFRRIKKSQLFSTFGIICIQGATKVVPKAARGTPRVRPGQPPGPQGCQKVTKKVTKNEQKWHHLPPHAPRLSRDVPGSLLGYPPHGKASTKGRKSDHMKRRFF